MWREVRLLIVGMAKFVGVDRTGSASRKRAARQLRVRWTVEDGQDGQKRRAEREKKGDEGRLKEEKSRRVSRLALGRMS